MDAFIHVDNYKNDRIANSGSVIDSVQAVEILHKRYVDYPFSKNTFLLRYKASWRTQQGILFQSKRRLDPKLIFLMTAP
jgi:hypothetical protein